MRFILMRLLLKKRGLYNNACYKTLFDSMESVDEGDNV